MSKERLEEIKNVRWENLRTSQILHVKWLIEQAERVQELEEDLIEQGEYYEELQNNHVRVSNQNKRYREALEFYADEENYKPFDGIFLSSYQNKVDEDNGEKARKALEESQ